MKCYSLLLGARNTPGRGQRFSPADDSRIREITFRHFPAGFTVLNADGGWFDPARRSFVEEESRQILVCTSRRQALRRWSVELARALQQDELLVVELGSAVAVRVSSARRHRPAAASGTHRAPRRLVKRRPRRTLGDHGLHP